MASVQSYAIQTGSASNSGGQDASPQVINADAKREHSFSLSQNSSPTKVRSEASSQYEQLRAAYEQEKAAIDWKYQQQLDALQKKSKSTNPLTKRLLGKVQAEWDQALQRRKADFEADCKQLEEPDTSSLDRLQVDVN